MFRVLLIIALALPTVAAARDGTARRRGARAKPVIAKPVRPRTPARVRPKRPASRAPQQRAPRQRARSNRAVVGRTLHAPRRYRRPYRPRARVYYQNRPRYRPVTLIVDHHFVYDRIARAERRMTRLEHRAARITTVDARRDLTVDAREMRSEIAALDRSADRIRSWYHWERSLDRIHRLRWRLDGVEHDLAVGRTDSAPAQAAPINSAPINATPISSEAFARIEYAMRAASFRDDKLRITREAAQDHWFTSAQARAMVRAVHAEGDKAEARAILAPRVIDPARF